MPVVSVPGVNLVSYIAVSVHAVEVGIVVDIDVVDDWIVDD